jgi:ubiquinone/menaquinone biosynthesis C-methylase UbiE
LDREVQQQFGAVAANYVASAVHARGADLAELVRASALRGDELVLDLGTAVGHTALAVAPRARRVIGVDLTAEMLGLAGRLAAERGVANVSFARADVSQLPFPAASFDLVTSRYSAHHYAQPDRMAQEVARVLRPGGRFVLADTVAPADYALDTFINTVELLRDRSHVRDHTVKQWQTMLSQAGLQSAVVYEWDVVLDFDDWVARMKTPPNAVAMLRSLLNEAPPAARETFQIRDDGRLSFSLKGVIIRAEPV